AAPGQDRAERRSERAAVEGVKVFFACGGGDAIDTAAKLARLYWQVVGQPERLHIIARTQGYHGTMAFGTSIGGIDANRNGFGPLVPSTSAVDHDSAQALRDEIERLGAERGAAFFIQPVVGAGGGCPPAPGYVGELGSLC